MPPMDGIAIGSIKSAPRPVAVMTGNSAKMVVAVVIKHGPTRRLPAAITASRMSCFVLMVAFSKLCFK
tara:strand:- start:16 stop:219 length:204 start_codon:yes stop_codon:yes gene_type:complete